MYAQPMDTHKLDGCNREDKAFNYSLNGQAFKNMFIICVLFMKESFEYSVFEGVTTSRLRTCQLSRAVVPIVQMVKLCRLALSQPGLDSLHIVSAGVVA